MTQDNSSYGAKDSPDNPPDKGRMILTILVIVTSVMFISSVFYFSTTSNSKIDKLQTQLMIEQQKREQYSKQLQTARAMNFELKSKQAIAQEEERVKKAMAQELANQIAAAELELQKVTENAAAESLAAEQARREAAAKAATEAAAAQAAKDAAAKAARQAAIQAQLNQQRQTTRAS